MRLALRIPLLLGLLVATCVAGLGATHWLLGRAGAAFGEGQAASARLARVQQLDLDLLATRNQLNIWLQAPNEATARSADALLARLVEGRDATAGDPALAGELQAPLAALTAALAGYRDTWAAIRQTSAARDAAYARTDAHGDRLGDMLGASTGDERLTAALMLARVAALRHRAAQDPQRLAQMEEALRALERQLAPAPAPVREEGARWVAAVREGAAAARTMLEQRATFRTQGNAMSEALTAMLARERAVTAERTAAAAADMALTRTGGLLTTLAVLAAGAVIVWLPLRGVVRPLLGLSAATAAIAAGRLDQPAPGQSRTDELGDMARALEGFRAGLGEKAALEARQAEERGQAEAARRAALAAMAAQVEREAGAAVARVQGRAAAMTEAAAAMLRAMEQASGATGDAHGLARQSLGATEAVSAATEQLSASVREISGQLSSASALTRQVAEQGEASRGVIAGLADGVGRIREVTRLIGDIAGQTNLLALNATIEAARAGEAGKGFAVVASEVKALAAQTAKATEEVSAQVGAIGASSEQAVAAMRGMADAVAQIDQVTGAIAAAVEEQAAATREIAARVLEAMGAVGEVSGRLDGAAAAVSGSREEAEGVRRGAEATRGEVEAFRGELVTIVRAATG